MKLARVVTKPQGFIYKRDFITTIEEQALLKWFDTLRFGRMTFHEQPSRREIRHYGVGYNFFTRKVTPAKQPLPPNLLWLRDRCAEMAGINADDIVEALITRYEPGAGLTWHTDVEPFGDKVMGVSLGGPCIFRLRKRSETDEQYWAVLAEPRSAYVMGGESRWDWQHNVMPTKATRYSITFRTLK